MSILSDIGGSAFYRPSAVFVTVIEKDDAPTDVHFSCHHHEPK